MAELLTVTEIKEKLTKYVPQNCFNSLLSYYSEIIEYVSAIDNANWNVSNRDNLRFFQLNCGNKYIIRNQEDSILVMCWREEFLSLDNEFINNFLEECKFYKEESTIDKIGGFIPKTKEDLSKIDKEALWQNTFQFLVPYTKLDEYKPFLLPSIKAFAKYALQNSKIMHNMETAYQKDFITLINETLSKTGAYLKRAKPDFDPRIYGYSRLTKLIEDFPKIYEVRERINGNKRIIHYKCK